MVIRRRLKRVVGLAGLVLLIFVASASAASSLGVTSATTPLTTCSPLSVSTPTNRPVTIQLQCRQMLGLLSKNPLTYAIVSGPAHGTLSLTATTGEAVYTPARGYAGADSFSYDATSRLGTAAPATVSLTVGGASTSTPTTNPTPSTSLLTVTKVGQSHSIWRLGNRLATFSRVKRAPIGTTFFFTLNQQARIHFAFTQQLGGRRVKGRCVAQTKKNRRMRSCKRTITRGALSFTAHIGVNRAAFQGRISRSRRLALGSYTLIITATTASGKHSSARSLRFRIVK